MTTSVSRRTVILSAAPIALAGCVTASGPETAEAAAPEPVTREPASLDAAFSALESRFSASLGLFALDAASGTRIEHRADERFSHASTLKALAAAAVFASAPDLETPVPVEAEDLVEYSPVLQEQVGSTLTLREVADAAVRYSDNTAGNLLLAQLGGPEGLEAALRAIGDRTTSVDRWEPELNEVSPGDPRDTSTPRALATSLRTFVLDGGLDAGRSELLTGMLIATTTGDTLIMAGAPEGWEVGSKSGAATYGTRNDLGIAWPPGKDAPIVIAVMTHRDAPDAEYDDRLIAEAAKVAFTALLEED
ncbi:class A beta-lactamase [Brachybacterium fresconis]|uniref:Beta-lactamase n=1 Tax=Brachybacterium fresconis TaxID=173363 RepID=A0ABS4YNC8_9MICO|nr:class A beta-lactamase [Brachybacterium fresconis]MBP2410298.1 beta-lactamase class A [Brachybacterium fresconis]